MKLKKATILFNVLFLAIAIALTGCGGGGGGGGVRHQPTQPRPKNPLKVVFFEGATDTNISLIAEAPNGDTIIGFGKKDSNGNLTSLSGIEVRTASGEEMTVFMSTDGLPSTAVYEDPNAGTVTFLYSNWTPTTVDLTVISPGETETTFKGVGVNKDHLAKLKQLSSSASVALDAIKAVKTIPPHMTNIGRQVILGWSIASCAASLPLSATGVGAAITALSCLQAVDSLTTYMWNIYNPDAPVQDFFSGYIFCSNTMDCATEIALEGASNTLDVIDAANKDLYPPVVSSVKILSPTALPPDVKTYNRATASSLLIKADATDPDGNLKFVRFFLDNPAVTSAGGFGEIGLAPWPSYLVNLKNVEALAVGTHTITAVALDSSHLTGMNSVDFNLISPYPPKGLTAVPVSPTQISVTWQPDPREVVPVVRTGWRHK